MLFKEYWLTRSFPFEFLYRQQPLPGACGARPLSIDEAHGLAARPINILLSKISRSHKLLAVGIQLVENNAKINTGSINDDIGTIIRYTGTVPQFVVPSTVTPGPIYNHSQLADLEGLRAIGHQRDVSKPQSLKPQGLDSGKAIATFADVQKPAASKVNYPREPGVVLCRIARMNIRICQEAKERGKIIKVKVDASQPEWRSSTGAISAFRTTSTC